MPAPESAPLLAAPVRPRHGFVIIDKPAGWTSFDVVARARRLLGVRKIGHAGTLDPAATGVLPLAVGQATRLLEYLSSADKTYEADITFGIATDSHDRDGVVLATHDAGHLTADQVEAALGPWRGSVSQVPPMHAALKVNGVRLYDMARRGESIERAPRPLVIHELTLTTWQLPVATLRVVCSKGTYIRSLARDLGDALGVGAHLSRLVRTQTGPFTLDHAITLDALAEIAPDLDWERLAAPLDSVLVGWPAIALDTAESRHWRHGKAVRAASAVPADRVRVYDDAGAFAGIAGATSEPDVWRPVKVVESGA